MLHAFSRRPCDLRINVPAGVRCDSLLPYGVLMSRSVLLRILRGLGAVAALCVFATTNSSRIAMQAQSSCGATINPIACENVHFA